MFPKTEPNRFVGGVRVRNQPAPSTGILGWGREAKEK